MIEYSIDIQHGKIFVPAACGVAQDVSAAAHEVARTIRSLLRDGKADRDDIVAVRRWDGKLLWSSTSAGNVEKHKLGN